MANFQIPLTYVVNVAAQSAGLGLEPKQLSTILLLTNAEQVSPYEGDYFISRTASAVEKTYGTNSNIFKMTQAIFAQNPNILNNNGYVICANLLDEVEHVTPATSGTLTTVDITSNIENFASINSGDLKITVDGEQNYTIVNKSFNRQIKSYISLTEYNLETLEIAFNLSLLLIYLLLKNLSKNLFKRLVIISTHVKMVVT